MLEENEQNQKILPSAVDYRVYIIISLQTKEFLKTKEFKKKPKTIKPCIVLQILNSQTIMEANNGSKWK